MRAAAGETRVRPGSEPAGSDGESPPRREKDGLWGFDGRDDKIRTCDLTHPKGALYQAEPRPDASARRAGSPTVVRVQV